MTTDAGAHTHSGSHAESSSRAWRLVRVVAVALGVALLVIGLVTQVVPRLIAGNTLVGTEFADPSPAPTLDGLLGTDGSEVALGDYDGKIVLLYFGYLSCPDVCPTTLATIDRALERLGSDADRVQVLMVSVDPARDTPEEIDSYLAAFNPSFIGLHADEATLAEVTSRWGIFFELDDPDATGYYDVTHTASLTGVDADGNLRVLWPFDTSADILAADLDKLL